MSLYVGKWQEVSELLSDRHKQDEKPAVTPFRRMYTFHWLHVICKWKCPEDLQENASPDSATEIWRCQWTSKVVGKGGGTDFRSTSGESIITSVIKHVTPSLQTPAIPL